MKENIFSDEEDPEQEDPEQKPVEQIPQSTDFIAQRIKGAYRRPKDTTVERIKARERQPTIPDIGGLPQLPGHSETGRSLRERLDEAKTDTPYFLTRNKKDGEVGLAQIESVVSDVNRGQRDLNKLIRLGNSPALRAATSVGHGIMRLFGGKPAYLTYHDIFVRQQDNVGELNRLLVGLVAEVQPDVEKIRGRLTSVLRQNEKEHGRRQMIEGNTLPSLVENYEHVRGKLQGLGRDDPGYFSALQAYVAADQQLRNGELQWRISVIGDEHHSLDIENLILQSRVLETVLGRAMEMAYITDLYQKTLDTNETVWGTMHGMGQAVAAVLAGVGQLADYNNLMNNTYASIIQGVTSSVAEHPGPVVVSQTNRICQRILSDVALSGYKLLDQYGQGNRMLGSGNNMDDGEEPTALPVPAK